MRRVMRHGAIVTRSQHSCVLIIVFISPELEPAAKIEEVFVMHLMYVGQDAEGAGARSVRADEGECITR